MPLNRPLPEQDNAADPPRAARRAANARSSTEPVPEQLWNPAMTSDGSRDDRILFVGDIHDKARTLCPLIDQAADQTDAGTIVLLGDLLNEWDISADDEIAEFRTLAGWIAEQRNQRDVIALLGNHDLTYWVDQGTKGHRLFTMLCPGYLAEAYPEVHRLLHTLDPRIMFGFTDSRGRQVLASHAGLTRGWWDHVFNARSADDLNAGMDPSLGGNAESVARMVNALAWKSIGYFGAMIGGERGGQWNLDPSPVWAGKEELAADPLPGFLQIVGHTPVPTVQHRICGCGESAAAAHAPGDLDARQQAEIWYCDTYSLNVLGWPIGDGSLLLYDRAAGSAWRVATGYAGGNDM